MTSSVCVDVKHEGATLSLRFDACRTALGGEFAGNVDLDVVCDPTARDAVVEHLAVELPDGSSTGPAIATGDYAGGVTLGFGSEPATALRAPPEQVVLRFAGEPIACVAVTLHESVPIEEVHRLIGPSELVRARALATDSSLVLLAANRERWWYLLVAALLGVGAVCAVTLPAFGLPWPAWWLGGGLVAAGCALGLYLARTPYRRVWLDRDRRRVFAVEGRRAKLRELPGRSLEDFAHVRLHMRWQLSHDPQYEDQEAWYVTLEGPLAWAGSDGRVRLHPEGLRVAEFRSADEARRLAADVAALTGLGILDTGHDGTA